MKIISIIFAGLIAFVCITSAAHIVETKVLQRDSTFVARVLGFGG